MGRAWVARSHGAGSSCLVSPGVARRLQFVEPRSRRRATWPLPLSSKSPPLRQNSPHPTAPGWPSKARPGQQLPLPCCAALGHTQRKRTRLPKEAGVEQVDAPDKVRAGTKPRPLQVIHVFYGRRGRLRSAATECRPRIARHGTTLRRTTSHGSPATRACHVLVLRKRVTEVCYESRATDGELSPTRVGQPSLSLTSRWLGFVAGLGPHLGAPITCLGSHRAVEQSDAPDEAQHGPRVALEPRR